MTESLRILHLEDDPLDTELVSALLQSEGLPAQIDRIDTLGAFREALERGSYSLILADYTIPGTDPMEAMRLAKRLCPQVPFIFLSGTMGEDLAIETLKTGANDYVLKHRMARLAPAVRRALAEAEEQTRRRQAEEELRRLNAELEQRIAERTAELEHRTYQLQRLTLELSMAEERERRRIAEILHEDLQQQLAAVKFHLGLLSTRAKRDPSQQALAVRLDRLLKDAIEKSRSLSHELSPAVLHRNDLAESLRWLAHQMQTRYGLTVHVDSLGEVNLQSDALAIFLFRVAQELLFNVVKHARVGEARVRVRRIGPCLALSVLDHGRGFDPGQLKETAGLGLLSIRERIELLGGWMKIKSAAGKGSKFHVVVPYEELATPYVAVEQKPEGRARQAKCAEGACLRVLLADDHAIVRQGLASLLKETDGIEVIGEAADGRQAVNLAHALRPDVVVMDVSMPMMSGEEAIRVGSPAWSRTSPSESRLRRRCGSGTSLWRIESPSGRRNWSSGLGSSRS
ncbi:MAG: response regulator [Phycisphaerales bacterium]